MAEKNMCEVCGSGDGRCGNCGNMCGYGRNNLLRWLLGIIIITWVFSIGMKFGEIKGAMERGGYGYGMGGHMKVMPMMGGASYSVSTMSAPVDTTESVRVIRSN
jgi:hypothetical protein